MNDLNRLNRHADKSRWHQPLDPLASDDDLVSRRTALTLAAVLPVLGAATTTHASVFPRSKPQGTPGIALTSDGLRVRYDRFGSGDVTLVFVHGWLCDRSYWHDQIRGFSSHRTVLVPDLIGHGDSDTARHVWSIEGLGDDVARTVRSAGVGEVVLVGHSMGGPVVIEAARRLGTMVRGLVLVDLHILLQTRPARAKSVITAAQFRASGAESIRQTMFSDLSDPSLRTRIVAGMTSANPDMAVALVDATGRYDIPAGLAALTCATTLIETDHGELNPAALRRAKSDLRITVVPGAGHFIMLEQPEVFDDLLAAEIEFATGRARMV